MSVPIDGAADTAALIERGIERYAAGDLPGAEAAWREALAAAPGDERARGYVEWMEFRQRGGRPVLESTDPALAGAETAALGREIVEDAAIVDERDGQDVTQPWSSAPQRRAPIEFAGTEAPVRRFLARTPTRPNLLPIDDVPELSDERVAALAGRASEPDVAAPNSGTANDDPLAVARRSLGEGDFEAAVQFAELAVADAGSVADERVASHSPLLIEIYERYLGDKRRLIRLGAQLPPQLDAHAAFILSRVDGTFSIDDLLDISGMERLEAARLVALMVRSGSLLVG